MVLQLSLQLLVKQNRFATGIEELITDEKNTHLAT
jgi:hypothetical protein